jgi:hypothetical protein
MHDIINKHCESFAKKVDAELKKGLLLRGVEVFDEEKLFNYVKTNCTCDSFPDKLVYKDKGEAFLKVENVLDYKNNKFETIIGHI